MDLAELSPLPAISAAHRFTRSPTQGRGHIARGGYSTAQQLGLTLRFNAIMFLLLEVPLVGYLLQPDATTKHVAATSRWLNANGLRITGALIGVLGAGLLIQGIAATAA